MVARRLLARRIVPSWKRRKQRAAPPPHKVDSLPACEFRSLAASVGRRLQREHPMQARAIMSEADVDGDGVVSSRELAQWWKRRAPTLLAYSAAAADAPATTKQLLRLGLVAAVPCFTFGFLDNAIMLVAGEAIENSIGVKLGLSGMACAAAGNVIADTTGQVSGGTVDRLLRPILPAPGLSAKQQASRKATTVFALGGALGIATGCVCGSFPLLWYEEPEDGCCEDRGAQTA